MLSSCLLSGLIIGSISTCVYALITDKNRSDENRSDENNDSEFMKYNKRDRKTDYLVIFSIIMLVSVLILYFTNKDNSEKIIPLKGGFSPKINNQPPF